MSTSGGQLGNQNAREGKRWRSAIQRALSRASGDVDKGLDQLADKLVKAAMDGNPWSIDHIADRIDGKATQPVDNTHRHLGTLDESGLAAAFDRASGSPPPPSVQQQG